MVGVDIPINGNTAFNSVPLMIITFIDNRFAVSTKAGGEGKNNRGPAGPEAGSGPKYVAYVFVFLSVTRYN